MSTGRRGIGWLEVGRQEGGGQGKEPSRCRRGVCHWEEGGTEVESGQEGSRWVGAGLEARRREKARVSRLVGSDLLMGRPQAPGCVQPGGRWAGGLGSPRPHGCPKKGLTEGVGLILSMGHRPSEVAQSLMSVSVF